MRITRIKKLRQCGIFHNFKWDTLPEFARFNLIYGQNWSGKTTLSRMLQSLELRVVPDGEVLISTDKFGDIRGDGFPSANIPVRVFNSDFVRDNVFSIEGKDIPPIIDLGRENKKKHDLFAKKQAELEKAKDVRDVKREKRARAKKDFDNHCKTCSSFVKEMLEGPGNDNSYGNYNKTKYRERAEEVLGNGDVAAHQIDDQTQKELLSLHRATPKPKIPEPRYPTPDLTALREKVVDLLSRTVTSGAIRSLRYEPDKAEWLRQGMGLRNASECPFCENRVSEQRELDLVHHFSAEYESHMKSLSTMAAEIDCVMESSLANLKTPDCAMIHDYLFDGYMGAKAALDDYCNRIKEYLDSLTGALARKRTMLFDPVLPDGILWPPDDGPQDNLVGIIRKHNNTCRNLANQAAEARQRLEYGHIAKDLEFVKLRDNSIATDKAANESETHVAALEVEVFELERDISNYSRPADKFNDDLRRYLGHGELRLDVREHGYVIARDGEFNPLPSEGEKTAIALLYFLQSLESDQLGIEKSVIVLDDPVSSLDANALFAAYGFIRERTKNAGQLLVLTHSSGHNDPITWPEKLQVSVMLQPRYPH